MKRTILMLIATGSFLPAQKPKASAPELKLAIEITSAPPPDAGGPDKLGAVAGRVIGDCKDCVVILFAKGGSTWFVQPWADSYRTELTQNNTFASDTHLGSRYAAILARRSFEPPLQAFAVPGLGNGVLAVAVTEGAPPH